MVSKAWPAYAERFPGELLGADAGLLGASDAARGRFAALQGDLDRAVELLEAGHAMHERLELPQLSVETGLDLGIVLLRRAGAGDADRASGSCAPPPTSPPESAWSPWRNEPARSRPRVGP